MSDIIQGTDPTTKPSFSLANRARRALWGVVYALLFRPSPRPLHAWRATLLRLFGAQIGAHVHVYAKAKVWAPWNLRIDDNVGVADDAELYTMALIHIKTRAVISQGAYLCAGTHDYESPDFQLVALPITVGERAWVCAQAFVGPGVTVGDGAVIGARSVVTRDLPAWTVCAGNPCRPLKPRVMRSEIPLPSRGEGQG